MPWPGDGELVCWAVSEHVENAGVHSGDATLVLPPQRTYLETMRRIRQITNQVAKSLCDQRPLQHPVPGQEQPGDGDRVQPARIPELSLRLEGTEEELHRRGHPGHHGARRSTSRKRSFLDWTTWGSRRPSSRSPGSRVPIPHWAWRWLPQARWPASAGTSTKRF